MASLKSTSMNKELRFNTKRYVASRVSNGPTPSPFDLKQKDRPRKKDRHLFREPRKEKHNRDVKKQRRKRIIAAAAAQQ